MRGFFMIFMNMKVQLQSAWNIHNNKNLLLLQYLPEALLQNRLSARGRTIGEQLAHMHNTRISWTEQVAKSLFQSSLLLAKETVLTTELLLKAFPSSSAVINDIIEDSWEKEGRLPAFKSGLIPFIDYLISHQSHHRGNILLTLKKTGHKLPDKLKWDCGSGDKGLELGVRS